MCSHFGIDTSEYTFPYVTAWSGDKDLTSLRASMETIKNTATALINDIEYNYISLTKEQLQDMAPAEKERKRAMTHYTEEEKALISIYRRRYGDQD